MKFNNYFITPILKSQFFCVNIYIYLSIPGNSVFKWLLFHFHFDGLKKGCDLEQKIVRFMNKENRTVESQSDCKDHQ